MNVENLHNVRRTAERGLRVAQEISDTCKVPHTMYGDEVFVAHHLVDLFQHILDELERADDCFIRR